MMLPFLLLLCMDGIRGAVFCSFPHGILCLRRDFSADGVDSAVGAGGENLGADSHAKPAGDAGILINDCVHSDSPLVGCLAAPA